MEIGKQQELGTDSLEEGDKYLMEINLEDLENTGPYRLETVYGRHDLKGDHGHSKIIPRIMQLSYQY